MDYILPSIMCDERKSILFVLGTMSYGLWIYGKNNYRNIKKKN